jgi:dTDP-4-amino-4,6-dideoxygalactose transaminase
LADSDKNGGLNPDEIDRLVTQKTKAVVVTHMWGNPCQMKEITEKCRRYDLRLVEDCSHAHGASYHGQYVGTFGDIGIWSLQSQKIIAAGEAGILVTNNREYYDKAQLLGHFNKRALQEMNPQSPLYQYANTGTGLKYRPGALGLAIAQIHLTHLKEWIEVKNQNALSLKSIVSSVEGIDVLDVPDINCQSAYYALAFTVNPQKAPFNREQLVQCMHDFGFLDIDVPNSTSSLHRYPIFTNPISPVFSYKGTSGVRGTYLNSIYISDHLVKISVPIDNHEGSYGQYFMESFSTIWQKTMENLCNLTQVP